MFEKDIDIYNMHGEFSYSHNMQKQFSYIYNTHEQFTYSRRQREPQMWRSPDVGHWKFGYLISDVRYSKFFLRCSLIAYWPYWGKGPLLLTRTAYQIRKIACCACAGNAGNVLPATDFKVEEAAISDPGMHHGTCVTHVVMHVGIANPRWQRSVSGIPGAWATCNFTYLARGPCTSFNTSMEHTR